MCNPYEPYSHLLLKLESFELEGRTESVHEAVEIAVVEVVAGQEARIAFHQGLILSMFLLLKLTLMHFNQKIN